MKKIFLLFLIFLFFSVKAYEFKHSLLPEELPPKKIETFEYAPYTVPEFGLELLAMLGTWVINPFAGLWFLEMILDDATPEFLSVFPATSTFGIVLTGNLVFKKHGSFLASVGGAYATFLPFYSLAFVAKNISDNPDLAATFTKTSFMMIPVGGFLGYVSSQKERQFDSGSLWTDVGGTLLGGIAGMASFTGISKKEFKKHPNFYALTVLGSTILGSGAGLSLSRTFIADEPDNAGTWLGVFGGTIIGAGLFYLLSVIPDKNHESEEEEDYTIVIFTDYDDVYSIGGSIIIGAVLGTIIGYAITHTTVPGRETGKKANISMTLLPPTVFPERVPFIEKKFTSWSILNLSVNF